MKIKQFLHSMKDKGQKYFEMVEEATELVCLTKSTNFKNKEYISIIRKHNNFKPSQKDSEISQLMELALSEKIGVICEIGTYRGGSLFLLSRVAREDALIISIDINNTIFRRFLYRKFSRARQKLFLINGNSQSTAIENKVKRILKNKKIDLLFIDGDHSFFGVINDYVRYSPLLANNGIIAIHDIHPDFRMQYGIETSSNVGGVPVFWQTIKATETMTTEIIEDETQDGYGLGIIFRNK